MQITKGNQLGPVIAPTLLNGWVNYGGGAVNAGYYKTAQGIVHIQGIVKSGTVALAFVLPVGYRIAAEQTFPVSSNASFGRLIADATGNISLFGSSVESGLTSHFRAA